MEPNVRHNNLMYMKNKHLISSLIVVIILFFAFSCKTESDEAIKPTLITLSITDITAISASSGGQIKTDGGSSVTVRGVVWSTSEKPTIENHTGITNDGMGVGTFSSNLTNLTPNTIYYVRAYATNDNGTEYGIQQTLTTQDGNVVLTTGTVLSITPASATCGGEILNDGGDSVVVCGVVWNTEVDPTIDNHIGISSDKPELGKFVSTITKLSPNTTYYVRAYATNGIATTYGNQKNFKTPDGVLDADGNDYPVVTIGTQVWMAENLKTTKYNDGTDIPNVTDRSVWSVLNTGAYGWYYDNYEVYGQTYGALYNWHAVNTGKLAPIGWHVATDAEWKILITYLGGKDVAGGKLKEAGDEHWSNPTSGATNETGFTALPGGFRREDGYYFLQNGDGTWWSASERSTDEAYEFGMNWSSNIVANGYDSKLRGNSVRCIKD